MLYRSHSSFEQPAVSRAPQRRRTRWLLAVAAAMLLAARLEGTEIVVVSCPVGLGILATNTNCRTPIWVGWDTSMCDCGGATGGHWNNRFKKPCDMNRWPVSSGVSGDLPDCMGYCTITETNEECEPDAHVESGSGSSQKPKQPPTTVGCPVSVTTGEMFFSHTDAVVGELAFVRKYSTARLANAERYGALGPGWNTSFEGRLRVITPTWVEVRGAGGDPLYYADTNADGVLEMDIPKGSEASVESIFGGYTRVFRAGGSEAYDANGQLQASVDAAGVSTTYTRDSLGRLQAVTRRGRSLTLEYEGSATRPARLLGPGGELLATYTYETSSGSNRLDAVDYPDGSGYRYGYDAAGRILWVRDAAGHPLEMHAYDSQGRATTSEIADGRQKLTLSYGTNQTTVTDVLGNATTYDWASMDHVYRVTKITGPCSSCGGGGTGETQEWTYDAAGNVTNRKHGSDSWDYTYNPSGDLLTETDPLDRTTTYTYDAQGRVTSVSSPGGGLTTTTYGPAGPLTVTEAVTATENRTTTLTYTAGGQVETVTDPRSKLSTFAYDAVKGDLLSVTDPLTHPTTFTYDALGRRTSVTDALNHSTTATYDPRGRVLRITQHDGTHTDFGYDKSGRRTSVTDPLGRVTRYVYDDYGHLAVVVDALSQTTAYAYDLMGQLTSLTDAKGQTTSFEYDEYGRVRTTIYPGGGQEVLTYDARGRLSTKTDRMSIVTTYAYDVLGRLTGTTYSDGTPAVSYTYDPAGRLETAANGTDTLIWAYDLAGQLLSEQSSKNGSTFAYSYDSAGNRLTLGLDGQLFVSYAYDDAGRLTGITRGANVFGFGYDPVNRRTSMSYPNGVSTTYSYDDLNRLLRLKADKGATPITDFQYVYDAAGNRLSKQQLDYTESYGYDPLYRLTDVTRGAGRTRYSYDPVGNRLGEQADGAVLSGTFNEKNQLLARSAGGTMRWRGTLSEPGNVSFTSATVNGKPARMLAGNVFEADIPAAAGSNTVTLQATDTSGNVTTKNYSVSVGGTGATYTYDQSGNLTSKVEDGHSWAYEWNAENQLKRVLKDSVEVARFAYDPVGRRVEKLVGATTTTYLHDAREVVRERDGSASRAFVRGSLVDEPLSIDGSGAGTRYLHSDGLGSVVRTTGTEGEVTLVSQYDPFGAIQMGEAAQGPSFTGRTWDPDVQLFDYRARWYDDKVGRFISEDPIGLEAGVNYYSYVLNNPVRFTDPSGLDVYGCQRPAEGPFMSKIPHGLFWSTKCNKSYSFGPSLKGGRIRTDDDPGIDANGKAKSPYSCGLWSSGECYEDCVCEFIEKHQKNPPRYGPNNMCWDARQAVDDTCSFRCKGNR